MTCAVCQGDFDWRLARAVVPCGRLHFDQGESGLTFLAGHTCSGCTPVAKAKLVAWRGVLATAAVPGGKAPVLITGDMVEGMRSGSVVVDLAAGSGGNCELTKAEERLSVGGVTIVGPTNLPSSIPYHASQLYSRNSSALLRNMVDEGEFAFNMEDQILRDTLLTQNGEVKNVRVLERLEGESEGNI